MKPTTLAELVALAESRNQPHAIRFEPAWEDRWLTSLEVSKCIKAHAPIYMNHQTAVNICCCSWGMYQIMGSNLYRGGYQHSIGRYLNSTEDQLASYLRYVTSRGIHFELVQVLNDKASRDEFAKKYNGSLSYGDRLLDEWKNAK